MKIKKIFALATSIIFLFSMNLISAAEETSLISKPNTQITFDARTLKAFSGMTLSSVTWDFADDTPDGNGITVTHSYPLHGVYLVEVTGKEQTKPPVKTTLPVIIGGTVPYVPEHASYIALYFPNLPPQGVYNLNVEQLSSVNVNLQGLRHINQFFNISSNLPNNQFTSSLIFVYSDVDPADGIVDGTNIQETTLNPYYYDGTSWKLIPNAGKNTDANQITVNVNRFSLFALLSGTLSGTPPTDEGSGGGSGSDGGGSGGGGGSGDGIPGEGSDGDSGTGITEETDSGNIGSAGENNKETSETSGRESGSSGVPGVGSGGGSGVSNFISKVLSFFDFITQKTEKPTETTESEAIPQTDKAENLQESESKSSLWTVITIIIILIVVVASFSFYKKRRYDKKRVISSIEKTLKKKIK